MSKQSKEWLDKLNHKPQITKQWKEALLRKNGYAVLAKSDRAIIEQLIDDKLSMPLVKMESWKLFRECKMLWWVNRLIHTFGWAIVVIVELDGTVSEAYPARVTFRGFSEQIEEAGFTGLTAHIKETIDDLVEETLA